MGALDMGLSACEVHNNCFGDLYIKSFLTFGARSGNFLENALSASRSWPVPEPYATQENT